MSSPVVEVFARLGLGAVEAHVAQVLPAGEFAARDGRPGPGLTWKVDEGKGFELAHRLSARAASAPLTIDFEHQALNAASNGRRVVTAGFMMGFEWRTGVGLWARVRWAPQALTLIEADEYRYISPVIRYSPADGSVQDLDGAALVSLPALIGMEPVRASLSLVFNDFPTGSSPDQVALQARAYQAERLAAGGYVSTAQAVAHVLWGR